MHIYLCIMKDEQKMIKSPKFQQILDKQSVKIGEARAAFSQPTLLHRLVAVDCEDPWAKLLKNSFTTKIFSGIKLGSGQSSANIFPHHCR